MEKKLKVPRWIISSVVFLRQIHISTDRLSSQREKHFVQNRSDSNDSQIHEQANPHEKICFLCFPFGKLLYNFLLTVVSLPTGRERAREWNRFFFSWKSNAEMQMKFVVEEKIRDSAEKIYDNDESWRRQELKSPFENPLWKSIESSQHFLLHIHKQQPEQPMSLTSSAEFSGCNSRPGMWQAAKIVEIYEWESSVQILLGRNWGNWNPKNGWTYFDWGSSNRLNEKKVWDTSKRWRKRVARI